MRDLLQIVIIAAVVAGLTQFFVAPYVVQGNSMEPTYRHGQWLLLDKVSYVLRQPDINDIIVFKYQKQELLKRVVRVNNDGRLWVEGDNKNHSSDSRTFGAIDPKSVVGKVL